MRESPLAYLITFRGYGTWLHGDVRGAVDRFHNRFGTPRLPYNKHWEKYNRRNLRESPFHDEVASKKTCEGSHSRNLQASWLGIVGDERPK
jgi:hypothetical protein